MMTKTMIKTKRHLGGPNGGVDDGESRRIAGAGVGVRYTDAGLSLALASAWQTQGGDAQSDSDQHDPRVWGSLTYRW